MLYTIVLGIKTPLNPGILDSSNETVVAGNSFETEVECYNTFFTKIKMPRAWLWLPDHDDKLIPHSGFEVINDTKAKINFDIIPTDFEISSKRYMASLIIDSEEDGHYLLREAVNIKAAKTDTLISVNYGELSDIHTVKKFAFPFQPILYETTRNTFFHVAIWMAMFLILLSSCFYSGLYLLKKDAHFDKKSNALTTIAIIFGIAGLLTGSMWAKYTWGAYWTADVKLNMTAISLLIYVGYWILRGSITDIDVRARVAAVYNLFAFVCMMVLIMVIPRLSDSLHPGNGGNPAFSSYDMDNTLRAVFYPAILAYFLIGLWMSQLYERYLLIKEALYLKWDN